MTNRVKSSEITRRDFVGGALLGSGSLLLSMQSPAILKSAMAADKPPHHVLNSSWTGPGGEGDYRVANGNTHEVVNAAHSIRDGFWQSQQKNITEVNEEYDLIIVGGGFSGNMTAWEFLKKHPQGRVLMLDNHRVFGGEAKQNEVTVDGYHLYAPQGSNGLLWPPENAEKLGFFYHPVWYELGLPRGDSPEALQWLNRASGTDKKLKFPEDNYDAMILFRDEANQGYFYKDPSAKNGHKWIKDPWLNGFKDALWPEKVKQELAKVDNYKDFPKREDWEEWLDSMTYKEFLQNEVGVTQQEVFDYLNPAVAAHGPGLGCDVISALAAVGFGLPAVSQGPTVNSPNGSFTDSDSPVSLVSFPGGNTAILRHFVKRMIPNSIAGKDNLHDIVFGKINFSALDRANQALRIRLNSTVVDVHHDGDVKTAKTTWVSYLDNETDQIYRVKAKAVVMASGQWVNKHIVRDAPEEVSMAMNQFYHAPMLVVNVAVRNWRFMEKLGITAARWFEGFGWFTNIRAPMVIDGESAPLDPDKPTMLTFYNPYTHIVSDKGINLHQQSIISRNAMFATPYSQIESDVRQQMNMLFGDYGFDDKKDIAAIISNRWGHAYVAPQPGFFFGVNGKEASRDVLRRGYGRIRFGHSELYGDQLWTAACKEGERAAKQVLDFV